MSLIALEFSYLHDVKVPGGDDKLDGNAALNKFSSHMYYSMDEEMRQAKCISISLLVFYFNNFFF
ncbi:hypothetical protein YC2023_083970 [Brassica napus]|uniref:Uncharacterized protein n=5 Tax=Brassica TaxID=3705 RepID=A0A0D3D7K5_BRAOL|nr:unnamed protein product [Brassica napus]VDD37183.1 unnamed protein product [Brassica oleracea]